MADIIAAQITSMEMDLTKANTSIDVLTAKIAEDKKCLEWQKKHRDQLQDDIEFYDLCKEMITDEIKRTIIFALEEDVDKLIAKLHKVLGSEVSITIPFYSDVSWTVGGECFDKRDYSDLKWCMKGYDEVDVIGVEGGDDNVCETLDEFDCYYEFFGDKKIYGRDEMYIKNYLFAKYLSEYTSHINESEIEYGSYDESADIHVVMKKRLIGVVIKEKFEDIMESLG
jgi:hypothetical protein